MAVTTAATEDIERRTSPTPDGTELVTLSDKTVIDGEGREVKDEGGGQTIEVDEIPNGGYGWVIAMCILVLNACTWGVNTTYGVYSSYYLEHNYYKATQLDYAWVGGLSAAIAVGCSPLANWLVRRFGFKVPMYIGACGIGVGQCLAGVCHTFGPFLVCQGVVFGLGLGLCLVPSQPLLAHWFDRRLSLAQGIAQAGSGVGGLVWANTTPLLLDSVGVKWTLVINGCICMALLIPAIFLMKGRHKAVQARSAPFQVKWIWHPGMIWIFLWAALTIMGYFIAIYSLASYCTNGLGLSQKQGGAVQSILAAGQIVGRPLWGYLLDRGGRINMVIVSYLICGVATLAIWLPGRSFGLMAFYGFVQGLTGGTIHSAVTPMVTSVVGVQDLASALAIYWVDLSIPTLFCQVLAILLVNYSRDQLGRSGAEAYSITIGFCAGLTLAGAVALLGTKRWLQGNWKPWTVV